MDEVNHEAFEAGASDRANGRPFDRERWPEGVWGYGDYCLGFYGVHRDSLLGSQFMRTGGKTR